MKLYIIGGLILALFVALGLAYWQGRGAGEADRLRDQVSTHERMNDADPDFAICPWHDRLLGDCE